MKDWYRVGLAAAIIGSAGLAACRGEQTPAALIEHATPTPTNQIQVRLILPETVPAFSITVPESIALLLKDKNPNPLYRGVSLTVFSSDGSYTHASLIENEGDPVLYTNTKAKEMAQKNQKTAVYIPGVGQFPIKSDGFRTLPEDQDSPGERPVFFRFDKFSLAALKKAEKEGLVSPAIPFIMAPSAGQVLSVPNPQTGGFDEVRVTDVNPEMHELSLENHTFAQGFKGGLPIVEFSHDYKGSPVVYIFGQLSQTAAVSEELAKTGGYYLGIPNRAKDSSALFEIPL